MKMHLKPRQGSYKEIAVKKNISKYVLYTWLLAHLLHPVLFGIYCDVIGSDQLFFGWDHLGSMLSFTCLGIIVSLPALFISFISLRIILYSSRRARLAITIWILAVLLAMTIGAYFMLMFFMGFFDLSFLNIFIPGMVAAVGAILIRYRQFMKLFQAAQYKTIHAHINHVSL